MVDYLEKNSTVGLIAPLLLDSDMKLSKTLILAPTILRAFFPMFGKIAYWRACARIGMKPLDVEATEGAAVMVRREAMERVGLMDESFFFYGEIVDWCLRFHKVGYRVQILPGARMIHCGKGSTKAVGSASWIELKRSEHQIYIKWLGFWPARFRLLLDVLGIIGKSSFYFALFVLSLGLWQKSITKAERHILVLRWILDGMPDRKAPGYTAKYGVW